MRPMISYDITEDKWCVLDGNNQKQMTAAELGEKYGIWNPIIYCQERREELRKLTKDTRSQHAM